jgi:hypothetical protein
MPGMDPQDPWARPACARGCGNQGFYLSTGPGRDLPEEYVCISCYEAEEFAPGHWLAGDRMHFLGRCNDCDARYAISMSLEKVEQWYRSGHFSQDVYEAYTHVWATSAFRFGSYGSWAKSPVIPEVVRLVAVMREVAAARKAAAVSA